MAKPLAARRLDEAHKRRGKQVLNRFRQAVRNLVTARGAVNSWVSVARAVFGAGGLR